VRDLPTGDAYLINAVKENLEFLRDEWTQEIDDVSLRITSTVLRILVVEDALGKVWRLAGFEKEPRIIAPDLEAFLEGAPRRRITFASAGGAVYRGMQIQGPVICDFALSDDYLRRRYEQQSTKSHLRSFLLSAFRESPCLLLTRSFPPYGIVQEKISRHELIQYVVNKLGGAHIDLRRDPRTEQKLILLDSILQQDVRIAEKRPVYYELLSIGQSLINSPDVKALMEKIL